jgi:hypothetical protein
VDIGVVSGVDVGFGVEVGFVLGVGTDAADAGVSTGAGGDVLSAAGDSVCAVLSFSVSELETLLSEADGMIVSAEGSVAATSAVGETEVSGDSAGACLLPHPAKADTTAAIKMSMIIFFIIKTSFCVMIELYHY